MNKRDLRRLVRSYLNELGAGWLNDSDDVAFGIDDYLVMAINDYASAVRSLRFKYGVVVGPGAFGFPFAAIGRVDADPQAVAQEQAANQGNMTLKQNQPETVVVPGHNVRITLKSSAAVTTNATVYTVYGYDTFRLPATEHISIPAVSLPPGGTITGSTHTKYSLVLSITASAGQPSTVTHMAGVEPQQPGTRIVGIDSIRVADRELKEVVLYQLRAQHPDYENTTGAPRKWAQADSQTILLYPRPASTVTAYVSGWEIPDLRFWRDEHEPPVEPVDQHAIAARAAFLVVSRDPSAANIGRAQFLQAAWNEAVAEASRRLQGARSADIVVGGGYNETQRYPF